MFYEIYLPHLWHFATLPFVYLLVTNLLIWRTITKDTATSHQTNIGEKLTLRAHRVSPASTSGFATPPSSSSNSSEILSFQKSFSKMHCNMMSSLLTVLLDFHIFLQVIPPDCDCGHLHGLQHTQASAQPYRVFEPGIRRCWNAPPKLKKDTSQEYNVDLWHRATF